MVQQNLSLDIESRTLPLISTREKEILILISYGITTKNIAKRLFLSKSTIETHRQSLLAKMGCNNVACLIRRGFELNILKNNKLAIRET